MGELYPELRYPVLVMTPRLPPDGVYLVDGTAVNRFYATCPHDATAKTGYSFLTRAQEGIDAAGVLTGCARCQSFELASGAKHTAAVEAQRAAPAAPPAELTLAEALEVVTDHDAPLPDRWDALTRLLDEGVKVVPVRPPWWKRVLDWAVPGGVR